MKRVFFLLFAIAVSVSVWGQGLSGSPKVLGKIQDVRGLVTVISGTQLVNAVSGAPLLSGTRISAASSGGATLVYDNGCRITLKPNESYLVKEDCYSSKVLGKIQDVRGLVTVISGAQLVNAVTGAPLISGTRIATAASGGATLVYDNGCHINLKANESYLVKEDCDCSVLQANVLEVGTRKPVARAASPTRTDPRIVGKLQEVKGVVTVIDGERSMSAMPESPMILDSRVLTGSNSGVTLAYANGCHVRLKSDERFTVKENTDCCGLVARVVPASSLLIPALILGAGGAVAVIVDQNNKNQTSGR